MAGYSVEISTDPLQCYGLSHSQRRSLITTVDGGQLLGYAAATGGVRCHTSSLTLAAPHERLLVLGDLRVTASLQLEDVPAADLGLPGQLQDPGHSPRVRVARQQPRNLEQYADPRRPPLALDFLRVVLHEHGSEAARRSCRRLRKNTSVDGIPTDSL